MQRFFSRISLMFQKLRHVSCVPKIANSFSQNFHQMIALKKLRKMLWIFLKDFFCAHIFVYTSSILNYLPVIAREDDQKKNLSSLWRHQLAKQEFKNTLFDILRKKRSDIETLSVDRVSNKKVFYGKVCRKYATKASPITFLILVNSTK